MACLGGPVPRSAARRAALSVCLQPHTYKAWSESVLRFFFFSSRRRHTRCLSDWSSDVCSSDLNAVRLRRNAHHRLWSQTNCTTARSLAHSDTDFVGFSDAGGGLGGAWLLRMRDDVHDQIPIILDEEIKARQSSLTRACQRPRLSSYFLARSDGWWRFRSNSKDCLSKARWTCWDALA